MRNLIKKIFYLFAGRPRYQKMFEVIHRAVLTGMGIGLGADCGTSGEASAITYVLRKSSDFARPLTVFDVGANVGNYAKSIIEIMPEDTKVYCLEPSKKTFGKLSDNLRSHKNVSLHNLGLSDRDGTAILYSTRDNSKISSLFDRRLEHFEKSLDDKEEVTLETLDGFCQKNDIDRIDLLKLDIEGNELKCLSGSNMLDSVNFIQFEFGGSNIDSRSYFQDFWYLLKDRYKIYRILPRGLYEIKNYRETDEVFLTTNYLAERKIK